MNNQTTGGKTEEHLNEHRKYIRKRKTQLPKKLIILSVEWDILYFDKQIDVDEDKEERLFGVADFTKNVIRVFRGKRKKENIFETIFHEWVHIVLVLMDYRYAFTTIDEERFVHAFSNALNDLFWRNLA